MTWLRAIARFLVYVADCVNGTIDDRETRESQ